MSKDAFLLINEFKRIKKMGYVKSLRKGTTGIGYTFETLLNKKEDQLGIPDFGTIELKCKLLTTTNPLSLFNCAPFRNNEYATRYIYEQYGYYHDAFKQDYKLFSRNVFSKQSICKAGYEFRLNVNYLDTRVEMLSFKGEKFQEIVCYWDFKLLQSKLYKKLANLAIVYASSYKLDGINYFKYEKLKLFKLYGFFEFLQLISNDVIFVSFYIKDGISINGNPQLDTHGVCFRIKQEDITKLFYETYKKATKWL